jgi:hypothetical protein
VLVADGDHFKDLVENRSAKPVMVSFMRWVEIAFPSVQPLPLKSFSVPPPPPSKDGEDDDDDDDDASQATDSLSYDKEKPYEKSLTPLPFDEESPELKRRKKKEEGLKLFVHFDLELFDCEPKTISTSKNLRLFSSHVRRRLKLTSGEVTVTNIEKSTPPNGDGSGAVVSCRISGLLNEDHAESVKGMIAASTIGVSPPMVSEDLIGRSFVLGDTIRLCRSEQESLELQSKGLKSFLLMKDQMESKTSNPGSNHEVKVGMVEEDEDEEEDDDDEEEEEEEEEVVMKHTAGPTMTHPHNHDMDFIDHSKHHVAQAYYRERERVPMNRSPQMFNMNAEMIDVVRFEVKSAVRDAFANLHRDETERQEMAKYHELARGEYVRSKPKLAEKFIGLTENLFQFRCELGKVVVCHDITDIYKMPVNVIFKSTFFFFFFFLLSVEKEED